MSLELFAAGAMLIALVVYALTGGADFGGGLWDLIATGPHAAAQRRAIERALAPVWEANHVWLIFVVVILFTAFPPAFARLGTDFHAPLTVLLLGIVLRGSAFVFRQYGPVGGQQRWGRVFAVASILAPACLGVVLGGMTAGAAWWRPFPLAVGALAIASFAMLAAVYLTVEVDDPDVKDDFRRRALASVVGVAITAAIAAAAARGDAPRFAARLLSSGWTLPLVAAAATGGIGLVVALLRRRWRLSRAAAIVTVGLLVVGWGAAQYPVLLAPDLVIADAAAPRATLRALVPVVVVGSMLLLPSLWWLMRVFKRDQVARRIHRVKRQA